LGKLKCLSSDDGQSELEVKSNLRRNELDCFEDNDLVELLFDAIEAEAGYPGGRAVPNWARDENILKLRQAREANVCTLNQFRQHLGLKRAFKSVLSFLVLMSLL
jgi:hypothetical protein